MLKFKLITIPVLLLFALLPIFCTLPDIADVDPPIVSLVYPYAGSILNGDVNVSVQATDNRKVKRLWYAVDGLVVEAVDADAAGASKVFELDVTPWADENSHAIQAFARDETGNTGSSLQILVIISKTGDIVPPVVSVTNPSAGQTVTDSVKIVADASDDRIVSEVVFYIDGDSTASVYAYPYEYMWRVDTLEANSLHSIYARAFDGARNFTNSVALTVTVAASRDLVPPVVSLLSPFAGQSIAGSIKVIADATDDRRVSEVAFLIDGDSVATDRSAPYEYNWSVASLETNSTHTVLARAYDDQRNRANSTQVNVTVVPAIDQVPPVARLIYPLAGQTLVGIVQVQVDAYDETSLDRVDFYVDGVFRTTVVAAGVDPPYTFSWDTRSLAPNSQHSLYFKAVDAAGNPSTNDAVLFTIGAEDTQPPALALLYPVAGDTLTGTINVTVDVTDNVAVQKVEYYVDGGAAGVPNFTANDAPWSYNWNTASWATNSNHTLYIKAFDSAGNTSVQGPVTFFIR
jgi:hypothetical protein